MKPVRLYMLLMLAVSLANTSYGQLVSDRTVAKTVYAVTKNGKSVGWLTANEYHSGNETLLITDSQIQIDLLITFTAKARTVNRYVGTVLTEGSSHRTLNGRKKLDNEIKLLNGKYQMTGVDDASPVTKAIHHAVTYLYFYEPVNITEIFSEVYMTYMPLKLIGDSTYRAYLPDHGTMTYTYKNGRLVHVVANSAYGEVHFTIVQ